MVCNEQAYTTPSQKARCQTMPPHFNGGEGKGFTIHSLHTLFALGKGAPGSAWPLE